MPIEWSGGLIICPMHRQVEYTLDSDAVDITTLFLYIKSFQIYSTYDHMKYNVWRRWKMKLFPILQTNNERWKNHQFDGICHCYCSFLKWFHLLVWMQRKIISQTTARTTPSHNNAHCTTSLTLTKLNFHFATEIVFSKL